MKRTTIDFGIDLGTTNSSIAVIDGIDAKVIPNKSGSGLTPSAIWIDKRGNIHVGEEAKQRALLGIGEDSDNAALEFKLCMGLGVDAKVVFNRIGRDLLPEDLSAEVLKSLRTDVRSNLGEEVPAAVITVPAAFENPQTTATRKAAEMAGFASSPLILEPVAASLAYGFQSESENVYWLSYDFGGGTFDAAVMRIRDGLIQVVNHDGNNFLGGKLIDWDIVTKKLIPAITSQFNLPDFRRGNPKWKNAISKMKYFAEQAKIEVCRTEEAQEIWIEGLCEDADGKNVDFVYRLTPADVEQLSTPHIEKSLDLCRKTLKGAELTGSDMDRIIMVGGTTLNPWVRSAVQSELGGRVEFGIDPVTVVARGAAIFAGTQMRSASVVQVPEGTWHMQIEHKPVGNVHDPDIGGRVIPPKGRSTDGCTVEFVDTKTLWRSGRVTLGSKGVFMTRLYAEKQRRHDYVIEFCDETGTQIAISPDKVSYTLGIVPDEHPPATMTIGVGLANGSVATYIEKGAKLPALCRLDHFTTVPLRAGNADDELRIPLIEGEHPRAERNHGIGVMTIKGTDIRRDLPIGSQVEIALSMDTSQQLRLQAYVNSLDEEFEISFNPHMKHNSIAELRKEALNQGKRLKDIRSKADSTRSTDVKEVITRIDNHQLIDQVDSLCDAAENDPDAVAQLDRQLRELAAAVDDAEDILAWPILLDEAEETRRSAEEVLNEHGNHSDREQFRRIDREFDRAKSISDPDILRRCVDELSFLLVQVLDKEPVFHIMRFEWLEERAQSMRDPSQAERIIAQGRRAMNNNDIYALKAANRQLVTLLPLNVQEEVKHINIGGTMTKG